MCYPSAQLCGTAIYEATLTVADTLENIFADVVATFLVGITNYYLCTAKESVLTRYMGYDEATVPFKLYLINRVSKHDCQLLITVLIVYLGACNIFVNCFNSVEYSNATSSGYATKIRTVQNSK